MTSTVKSSVLGQKSAFDVTRTVDEDAIIHIFTEQSASTPLLIHLFLTQILFP